MTLARLLDGHRYRLPHGKELDLRELPATFDQFSLTLELLPGDDISVPTS